MYRYAYHQDLIIRGMWRAIAYLFVMAITGLLFSGCYSLQSTAADKPRIERGALNLHQAVCRHPALTCFGSSIKWRNEDVVFYLDEMWWSYSPAGLSLLSIYDIARIEVITDISERAMYSRAGKKAVVNLISKK